MGEWTELELAILTTKIGSGATPRGGSNSYKEDGISLIRSQNVLDFKFSFDGLAFIDQEQADQLNNVVVEKNDILLNITGDSVARCCIVSNKVLPARVNQHVSIIRTNHNKADQRFIFYNLQAQKEELLSQAEIGATRRALTKGMLENFKIQCPTLPEQKAIAAVLSSLDDKIDLLHRQNKTLEGMAETLFRQWFVEEAEEDWEVEFYNLPLEIIDGDRGKNYPKNTEFADSGYCLFLSAQNVTANGFDFNNCCFITKEKDDILRKGKLARNDIVLTTRGTVGNIAFYQDLIPYDNVRINSGMVLIRAKQPDFPALYIYLLMKTKMFSLLIEEHTSGSAQPQLPIRDLKRIRVPYPPLETLTKFVQIVNPIYDKIFQSEFQISTLVTLRDTLLPKLMSGEVIVEYTKERLGVTA